MLKILKYNVFFQYVSDIYYNKWSRDDGGSRYCYNIDYVFQHGGISLLKVDGLGIVKIHYLSITIYNNYVLFLNR